MEKDKKISSATEELLIKRAKQIAKTLKKQEPVEKIPLLSFKRGKNLYSINQDFVQGTYPLKHSQFCKIPNVPDFLAGISNVRGRLYSIIDLAPLIEDENYDISETPYIILIKVKEKKDFGILSDCLPYNTNISNKEILPKKGSEDLFKSKFMKGITKDMHILIDIKEFSETEEIIIDD